RGGFGIIRNYMVLCSEASFTVSIGRSKFPPWGVDGGCQGTPNYCIVYKHNEEPKRVRKVAALRLVKGEMVSLRSAGGGGWGSPLDRDPKLVQWDVKNDYITIETARNVYGVVIDPKTLEIDMEATKKLREEIKRRGVSCR
ncbi:MAG: hydantoinase B/oxoprolinase family protein, partial [Candidatus Korarchaeum sp.]